jgi:hypothetical protein
MTRFTMKISLVGLVGLAAVAGSACGGSSSSPPDPGPSSGVTAGTRIVDLSEADAAALCDWAAARFGGYGHGVTCMDGFTVTARQTRELCMMDYKSVSSTCPVTVGDIEACTNQSVGPPVCASLPTVCTAIIPCAT